MNQAESYLKIAYSNNNDFETSNNINNNIFHSDKSINTDIIRE